MERSQNSEARIIRTLMQIYQLLFGHEETWPENPFSQTLAENIKLSTFDVLVRAYTDRCILFQAGILTNIRRQLQVQQVPFS